MLHQLRGEQFDLCIIGAGASGAGAALDAAIRGLKVALIDRDDFAAGTSSRSTKLIHGGVRYLEQAFKKMDFAQLKQVKHGLHERHSVLANAPHLARPLPILTPVFSKWEGFYYAAGLQLYGWFASGKDRLPKSRWLSKKEALALMPQLTPDIEGAVLYYDGQLDDARYALALVQSAVEAGAVAANYVTLNGFEKNEKGQLTGAWVQDTRYPDSPPFVVRAKVFLNCTGPFADAVRHWANPDLPARIQPSKGVHAVLPIAVSQSDHALLIPKTSDGRVVFAVPFQGALLLGTTDEPYAHAPDVEPVLEQREVEYLLETLNPYLAQKVLPGQVQAGFGGLRPLITAGGRNTRGMLRDHEVETDPASGLLSLLGGKWTTYRLMAKDAVDEVARLLHCPAPCGTDQKVLSGGDHFKADGWEKALSVGLDADIARHLHQNYGAHMDKILERLPAWPEGAERIVAPHYPYIKAEVEYAVRYEMCVTLRDFLARRIRLELLDWSAALAAAPVVAALMARALDWTPEQQQSALDAYVSMLRRWIASATHSSTA